MNKPSSYGRFEPLFCCPAILCLLSILWLTDNTRGEEILQRCINNSLWAFFLKRVKLKEETTWTAFLKREEEGFMLNLRFFVLAEKGEKDLGVINNVCWVYKIQNKTKKKDCVPGPQAKSSPGPRRTNYGWLQTFTITNNRRISTYTFQFKHPPFPTLLRW